MGWLLGIPQLSTECERAGAGGLVEGLEARKLEVWRGSLREGGSNGGLCSRRGPPAL